MYIETYIRKRHLYIHVSRLMQSENGILLLFYICLSHGNEKKKKKKKKMEKGGMLCPVHKHLCGDIFNIPPKYRDCKKRQKQNYVICTSLCPLM